MKTENSSFLNMKILYAPYPEQWKLYAFDDVVKKKYEFPMSLPINKLYEMFPTHTVHLQFTDGHKQFLAKLIIKKNGREKLLTMDW